MKITILEVNVGKKGLFYIGDYNLLHH